MTIKEKQQIKSPEKCVLILNLDKRIQQFICHGDNHFKFNRWIMIFGK